MSSQPSFSVGQLLTAKFDLGDTLARGKKTHLYANKGDTLIIKEITDNLTHPLRVAKLKAKDIVFGIHPVEAEIQIENVKPSRRAKSKSKV